MTTVLITGASKGIGKAAARRFLDSGARVINLSRTPSQVDGIENRQIDLAAAGAADDVASLAAELTPGVIHLIHNAATLTNDSVRDTTAAHFREIIEVNLIGPQLLNQALLPAMKTGSSIIYIGSTLSEKAVPNSYTYVTTKHAMVGMMRATCQDLIKTGIHTACVCPGFTNTEMLRTHVGESDDILQSIAAMSGFGRLIEPDEIAETILFAANNPVINGAVIHANLGQVES